LLVTQPVFVVGDNAVSDVPDVEKSKSARWAANAIRLGY